MWVIRCDVVSWREGFSMFYLITLSIICRSDAGEHAPVLQDWGRMAAHFIRDQWVCLGFLARQAGPVTSPLSDQMLVAALQCSVDALALLPSDLVLPVLTFMGMALARVSGV